MGRDHRETTSKSSESATTPVPDGTSATDFASLGRVLSNAAAQHHVDAPGFRSPPRLAGVRRSVTRNLDGSVTVAVVVRDRPIMAVMADMIDGVVLSSGLEGPQRRELHDQLWLRGQRWLVGDQDPKRRHLRVAA